MPFTYLLNANIYTLDDRIPRAHTLVIDRDKIVAVSPSMSFTPNPGDTVLDLQGRTVIPGLTDSHIHFEWYSISLGEVAAETDTLEECLARVAARAQITPPGEWITGYGWNQNPWGRFPTKADLDRVAPNHPVYLRAKSAHAGWANSRALALAHITPTTTVPTGGEIQRDSDNHPTGILLENAMDLVGHLIPEKTPEQLAQLMLTAQTNAWRYGLTGVHDFDGRKAFSAYQLLRERGQLGLRVTKMLRVAYLDEAVRIGLRSGFGDEWLKIGNVKVFMDGALGPRTALMLASYDGEPQNYGISVTDKEALYEYATKAAAAGLAMTVHAIGDKANHDLLDVYETIRGEERARGTTLLRHRCEHVQILHPDDFGRLGALNVIASMQPLHATSDMLAADKYWGARSVGAYTWRTQLHAGATLAFGSDCPIESCNPFLGIHAAVTRRRADGTPSEEGWYPEQKLSVIEAVRGFTVGAAYAGYRENEIGSLTPGKYADMLVLDRDIFTCDPMAIKDTEVLGTMVGGAWKYKRHDFV